MSREKNKAIRDLLLSELDELIDPHADYPVLDDENISTQDRKRMTKGEVFIKQLVMKAMRGDNKSSTEILDRLYGKAPQHITQEIGVKNYTNFLEHLASLEDAEIVEVEVTEAPQIPAPETELFGDLGIHEQDTEE